MMKKRLLVIMTLVCILTACKPKDDIDFNVSAPEQEQDVIENDKEQDSNAENDKEQDSNAGNVNIDTPAQDNQGSSDNNGDNNVIITYVEKMGEVSYVENFYVENGEIKTEEWKHFEAYYPTEDPVGGLTFAFNYGQQYNMTKITDEYPMRYLYAITNFPEEPDLFFITYGDICPHVAVANVKTQTIEAFPTHEAWKGKNVSQVTLLPDCSLMFVNTAYGGYTGSYFYDGQNVVAINNLLKEYTEIEFTSVYAKYLNAKIVLYCVYTGGYQNVLYTFEYNADAQELIPCLSNVSYEASTTISSDLYITESGYGLCLKDARLTIVNPVTGDEEITDIPTKTMKWTKDVGDGILLVAAGDNSLTVLNMETGRVMTKVYIYQIADTRVERVMSDRGLYISMYSSDASKQYIYELLQE